MKPLLLIALLSLSPVTLAAVYKCQAGTHIAYSDRPCGLNPAVIAVPSHAENRPPRAALSAGELALLGQADARAAREAKAAEVQRRENNQRWEQGARLKTLQAQRRVGRGMPAANVRAYLGDPSYTRYGSDAHGEWEEWVYDRGRRRNDWVRFRGGLVDRAN